MGLKSFVKSAAKGAAKSIVKGLKPSKEITSTLNEFGTVEKATIALSTDGDIKNIELIHVQINPSDINYEYEPTTSLTTMNTSNASSGDQTIAEPATPSPTIGSMNFTLYYDFYDEYYARSANGSGFSLNSILSSGNGFHLKNKEYSSLEKLIQASRYQSNIIFKWGSFEEFGRIKIVNPRYTAFSPWGEPLKANAYVDISPIYNTNMLGDSSGNLQDWYSKLQKEIGGASGSLGGALNKLGSTIKALR